MRIHVLKVIKDIEQIRKLQIRFEFLLKKHADKEVRNVRLKGDLMTVYWNKDSKIIYPLGEPFHSGKDRFWNPFGISEAEPKSYDEYDITVETNFPCDIKSKPHGKFAVDSNDKEKVFILHNGHIRVGKKSCNIFDVGFKGRVIRPEEIDDGKNYALVCQLTEANQIFVNWLADFIYAIKDIRDRNCIYLQRGT
jgi:hypothetical protein